MEQSNARVYRANNREAFRELVFFAAHLETNISIYSGEFAVVVFGQFDEMDRFIMENSLDVDSEPMTVELNENKEIESLRKHLAERGDEISRIQKERDKYKTWWTESFKRNDRVKAQIKAIETLLHNIFPDVK